MRVSALAVRSPFRAIRQALGLTGMLLLFGGMTAGEAVAQTKQPAPQRNKVTLSDALEQVRWNVAERGSLLAVDPDHVLPATPNEPLPTGRHATSIATVAPLFSRRLVSVGTLTVLAPETMMVLNPQPEEQAAPPMRRDEAIRLLLPTFNESQWKQVGSDTGIGADNMETQEQRLLFRVLTTAPMPVQLFAPEKSVTRKTLLPGQLTGLRFRIQRSFTLVLVATGTDGQEYVGPVINSQSAPKSSAVIDQITASQLEQAVTGKWVARPERNHLKPGDLDFAATALDAPVRLSDIQTVGEAVKRCAEATHLELYADGRMARLPLYLRAGANVSVRSGDLLKGLCWMLTGTFRKVSNGKDAALLLTDDRAGYGTRMARIYQVRTATAAVRGPGSAIRESDSVVSGKEAWRLLSDSPYHRFTPTGSLRQALDTAAGNARVRPGDLSEEIRQEITQATEGYRGNIPLNQDQIAVRIFPQLELLVPGLEPVRTYNLWGPMQFFSPSPPREPQPEPGPVPATLPEKTRQGLTLLAAPRSPDAARSVIHLAAERGIRYVWLDTEEEIVRVGVTEGRTKGIAVGAVVSLLRAQPGDTTPRDIDLFGKESDWLLPDALETFAKLQRTLRAYTAIRGLATLVLTDTAPPGYGIPEGDLLAENGSEVGYTPARRLAYLRSAGFDPIDLVRGNDESDQPLPFLRDHLGWDEVRAANDLEMFRANRGWGVLRSKVNLALMRRLYQTIRSANPTLPLLVRNRGVLRYWYGSWDTPEGLPYFAVAAPTPVPPPTFPTLFTEASRQSQQVLLGVSYRLGRFGEGAISWDANYAPLPDGEAALARAVNMAWSDYKAAWHGLVLDLRLVPITKIPELLDGVQ